MHGSVPRPWPGPCRAHLHSRDSSCRVPKEAATAGPPRALRAQVPPGPAVILVARSRPSDIFHVEVSPDRTAILFALPGGGKAGFDGFQLLALDLRVPPHEDRAELLDHPGVPLQGPERLAQALWQGGCPVLAALARRGQLQAPLEAVQPSCDGGCRHEVGVGGRRGRAELHVAGGRPPPAAGLDAHVGVAVVQTPVGHGGRPSPMAAVAGGRRGAERLHRRGMQQNAGEEGPRRG
mmetsp:Transcript_158983/g.486537  ORF Transcript_158983/g.486537 Transcript_158983/m.486537 type:complete len:236 (+) Transcript_158983:621-1328(+)